MRPINRNIIRSWILLAGGVLIGIFLVVISAAGYHTASSSGFCMSCHSMEFVGSQWQKSQHKQFACTECHMPDAGIATQLGYKAKAGIRDLFHETLRTYPASLNLSDEGRNIVLGNCLRCHYSTIEATPMAQRGGDCIKCHRFLIHGRGPEKGGIKVE